MTAGEAAGWAATVVRTAGEDTARGAVVVGASVVGATVVATVVGGAVSAAVVVGVVVVSSVVGGATVLTEVLRATAGVGWTATGSGLEPALRLVRTAATMATNIRVINQMAVMPRRKRRTMGPAVVGPAVGVERLGKN